MRLLEPLADELRVWRERSGKPPDQVLVFPGDRGGVWTAHAFEKWRRRRFGALLKAGCLNTTVRTICATRSRRCCCTRAGT
jgi:hypothetical protein